MPAAPPSVLPPAPTLSPPQKEFATVFSPVNAPAETVPEAGDDTNQGLEVPELSLISKRSHWVLAQQRYAKSHRILANCRGAKDFRRFRNSQDGTWFSRSVLGA